jgi:hypothetical protein
VNYLKDYVEDLVPSPTDHVDFSFHKKREVKEKKVFLESMKDHLIRHIVEKTFSKEMYDALVGLYYNGNI